MLALGFSFFLAVAAGMNPPKMTSFCSHESHTATLGAIHKIFSCGKVTGVTDDIFFINLLEGYRPLNEKR